MKKIITFSIFLLFFSFFWGCMGDLSAEDHINNISRMLYEEKCDIEEIKEYIQENVDLGI